MVWAVTALRTYLECVRFTVRTDDESIKWLLAMSDAEGTLARCNLRLQEFDFDVVYCPGIVSCAADALSRLDSDATKPTELDDDIPTLRVIVSNRDSEEQGGDLSNSATSPTLGEHSQRGNGPSGTQDSPDVVIDEDKDLLPSERDIVEVPAPPFPVAVSPRMRSDSSVALCWSMRRLERGEITCNGGSQFR